MERKQQGFFSAVRGLSPARSREKSPARSASPISGLLRRRRSHRVSKPEVLVSRSGSLKPPEALSPLMEGPDPEGTDDGDSRAEGRWGHWMRGQLCRAPSVSSPAAGKRSDLRLLLGVLGAPLAPVHVSSSDPFPHLSIKDTPIFLVCNCIWFVVVLLLVVVIAQDEMVVELQRQKRGFFEMTRMPSLYPFFSTRTPTTHETQNIQITHTILRSFISSTNPQFSSTQTPTQLLDYATVLAYLLVESSGLEGAGGAGGGGIAGAKKYSSVGVLVEQRNILRPRRRFWRDLISLCLISSELKSSN